MPGLDYYGADYDAYERGNPLVSIPGFAVFGGAELAGSKFGLGGLATRQFDKGKGLISRAAALGGEAKALPQWVTPTSNIHGGYPGQVANSQARSLEAQAHKTSGKGRALQARSKANTKWAKSLKNIGRGWGVIGTVTIGYELGKAMFSVGGDFRIRKQDLAEQRRKIYNEDTFMDSRAAFTQRQRAIQVIHNSQMGVRSAMGSEASYLHY